MEFFLKVAAKMLGGVDADPGLLHYDLITELKILNQYCQQVNSNLISEEVIAVAVLNWQTRNPQEAAYKE